MRLSDKVAVITGAANGIGRATAMLFADEGARLVLADRDVAAGRSCVCEIGDRAGEAQFVETDVSSDSEVERLFEHTAKQHGGVDVLVNCAGIDILATVVDTEPDRWHRVIDVNLASVYRTCRLAIPSMVERGGGAIVNVASLQGMFGWPHYAAYAASKAGIIGLTRQIAVDYADHNVRSNSISPGGINTSLTDNSKRLEQELAQDPGAPGMPESAGQSITDERPRLRRFGWPQDVAYSALFLASDEAAYISGQNLVVDGIYSSSG